MVEEVSDFLISLLPSNAVVFILYLGVVTLFSITLIYLISKLKKKEKPQESPKDLTIDDLITIANNKNSNTNDLIFTLEYFLNNFNIKNNEKKSFELFKKVLNHKNRSKKLFDIFHGKLLPLNLEYKDKLDKLEKEALNK